MHPPILGRLADDGPRHARAGSRSGLARRHLPLRRRRPIALLIALLLIPTAATVADGAGLPRAVGGDPSLRATPPGAVERPDAGERVQDPHTSEATPGPATAARTELVAAATGETIWSIAEANGMAPGLVLRHNRGVEDTAAFDALASGRPLEQPAVLIVPTRVHQGEERAGDEIPGERDRPFAADPDLAALEPVFDRWADHFGVPRDLLKALAWVESGWNNDTRSVGGGIGIGRLQPLRAQYLSEHVAAMALDPTVAVDNIALTAAQLRVLLDETPDVRSAIAAHRQGITDTRMSGVDPMLDGYVDAVVALRLRFA